MKALALGPILLLVIAVIIIVPIILICVALAGRKGRIAATPAAPSGTVNPAERNRRREAILEKLAKKEITRDEAEQQLLELDKPLPEQMPPPPPRKGKGCGAGCLIAAVVGIIGLVIVTLLMYGLLSFRVQSAERQERHRMEQMHQIQLMEQEARAQQHTEMMQEMEEDRP